MFTLIFLFLATVQLLALREGLPSGQAGMDADINNLEKQGFEHTDIIEFYEGHLNILDHKNSALLSFSLSYILFFGFLYEKAGLFGAGGPGLMHIFGFGSASAAFVGLLLCFHQLIRVKWQDYGAELKPQMYDLLRLRTNRTMALRVCRAFYITSCGLFLDFLLLWALTYPPFAEHLANFIMTNR